MTMNAKPIAVAIFLATCLPASADEKVRFDKLADEFRGQVHPFVGRYCLSCHSAEKREADLDLERFAQLSDVRRDPKVWQKVARMLADGEMPPEKSDQPPPGQLKQFRTWIDRYLKVAHNCSEDYRIKGCFEA